MDLNLKNKVVIVTGGSEGIGRAAAWRFASEEAIVVICARRLPVLEQTAKSIQNQTGSNITPIVADVNNVAQIKSMVDQVIRTFGRIDILVNNAGNNRPEHFTKVKKSDMDYIVNLNIKACFNIAQICTKKMLEAKNRKKLVVQL